MKKFKPTHTLIKEFRYSEDEVYPAETLVVVPKPKYRKEGFGGNAFFLDKNKKLAKNSYGAMAWFSLSIFKPLKNWFENIEKT